MMLTNFMRLLHTYILSSCNYIESEVKSSVNLENTTFLTVEVCSDRDVLDINSSMFESDVRTVTAFFLYM